MPDQFKPQPSRRNVADIVTPLLAAHSHNQGNAEEVLGYLAANMAIDPAIQQKNVQTLHSCGIEVVPSYEPEKAAHIKALANVITQWRTKPPATETDVTDGDRQIISTGLPLLAEALQHKKKRMQEADEINDNIHRHARNFRQELREVSRESEGEERYAAHLCGEYVSSILGNLTQLTQGREQDNMVLRQTGEILLELCDRLHIPIETSVKNTFNSPSLDLP